MEKFPFKEDDWFQEGLFASFENYYLEHYDKITHWSTLSGKKVVTCDGYFKEFTPDTKGIVTVSYIDNTTYVFSSLQGDTKVYKGVFYQFTPSGKAMVLVYKKEFGSFSECFYYESQHDGFYVVNLADAVESHYKGNMGTLLAFTPNRSDFFIKLPNQDAVGIYTLSGDMIARFDGHFSGFTPDGKGLIINSRDSKSLCWYDFSGIERGRCKGFFRSFTPDNDGLIAYSQEENMSYWLSFSGQELISYTGELSDFWQEGDKLVASFYNSNTNSNTCALLGSGGEQQSLYEGRFLQFMPGGDLLVVEANLNADETYASAFRLISLTGEASSTYKGNFEAFTPNAAALIADCSEERKTRRYDLFGEEQAVYEDWFHKISPDGSWVVTYHTEDYHGEFTYRIFNLAREEQAVYKGYGTEFTPSGNGIIINSFDQTKSFLFTFGSGDKVTYKGIFSTFTPDSSGMITYSPDDDTSRWLTHLVKSKPNTRVVLRLSHLVIGS